MTNNQERENHPIDESETDLCRTLWVSVALQAVVDARSQSKKPALRRAKQEALEWLRAEDGDASDLASICDLAGLDFKKTQTRLLEIVASEEETADFRCIKKALMDNRGLELRSKYLKRITRQEKARKRRRAKHSKMAAQSPQFEFESRDNPPQEHSYRRELLAHLASASASKAA